MGEAYVLWSAREPKVPAQGHCWPGELAAAQGMSVRLAHAAIGLRRALRLALG
jgi:hypothetical protein